MTEPICLQDRNDKYTRQVVERSNRRYELHQSLGPDITDRINIEVRETSQRTFMQGSVAIGAVGAIVATGCEYIEYRERDLSRRFFLVRALPTALGVGIVGIAGGAFWSESREYATLTNNLQELTEAHPDRKEDIMEYARLQYPIYARSL